MFEAQTYIERRKNLKEKLGSGLLLFLGNNESPENYVANTYSFRQDSTFLYYFGLDLPGLSAIIDVDSNTSILYGNELSVDDVVWMGSQPGLAELAEKGGIDRSEEYSNLINVLSAVLKNGRKIHFLPQYRAEQKLELSRLIGIQPNRINDYASKELIRAVVEQRSVKSNEEIKEIDAAVDIAYRMHTSAMKIIKPGITEKKIAGMIEGIALSLGAGLSFRPIVSINGEILHNPYHENEIQEDSLLVIDSGAETDMHYASDITRTIPGNGKFTDKHRSIYEIVLRSQMNAIENVKPGITNKELHLIAAKAIVEGLSGLGIMHGNVDEAVQVGAHALFFPHGLGHMMGLDVHDMEGLGEDYVGYDENIKRSDQFGLAYLRLAKELKPGYVFTIEPGIYFIPALINKWKEENKFTEFINYERVEDYRDFGGIRIEDNILVTEDSYRILGKPIPKTVDEIESICSK